MSICVHVDELVAFARATSRGEFIAAHPGFFLALAAKTEVQPIVFVTAVMPQAARKGAASPRIARELLPLRKGPTNPFRDRISVGRAKNCDVVLRDASVSKLHAHFHVAGGAALHLVDLDSQNGTYVNGIVLAPHVRARIAPGDQIAFGDVGARIVDAGALYELLVRQSA
jgi:hypothetical protein